VLLEPRQELCFFILQQAPTPFEVSYLVKQWSLYHFSFLSEHSQLALVLLAYLLIIKLLLPDNIPQVVVFACQPIVLSFEFRLFLQLFANLYLELLDNLRLTLTDLLSFTHVKHCCLFVTLVSVD